MLLYWNSRDKQWLSVSDTTVEHTYYQTGTYEYPGNGIGNAYVTPVISADGQNVVVLYQGPEYSGTPGVGEPNAWTPTTNDPDEINYTDLYYSVSNDGGVTWSPTALVPSASAQKVQECYPAPAPWLYDNGDNTGTVNLLFMIDDIPGTSLFDNNNSANNNSSWNYTSFSVATVTVLKIQVIKLIDLNWNKIIRILSTQAQLIKYTISERSNVSLKVYDMLGREVATLDQ